MNAPDLESFHYIQSPDSYTYMQRIQMQTAYTGCVCVHCACERNVYLSCVYLYVDMRTMNYSPVGKIALFSRRHVIVGCG